MDAAEHCLQGLAKFRDERASKGARGKRKASKEEVAKLFRKKAKASPVWKHRFICLASVDQTKIPTREYEKDELLEAGLGEKEIAFEDLHISADEFRDILYDEFPRLRQGGGFRLYRCMPNTRNLEPLSVTVMSSPAMLKARVGTARTYIKPVQQSLELSPVLDLPSGVSCIMHNMCVIVVNCMYGELYNYVRMCSAIIGTELCTVTNVCIHGGQCDNVLFHLSITFGVLLGIANILVY